MNIKNVSFIGLGVMGYPMSGYLKKNNFNITVFNRTNSKSKKWVEEFNGQSSPTQGEAVKNADAIFICVGRDDDLREVMEGEN